MARIAGNSPKGTMEIGRIFDSSVNIVLDHGTGLSIYSKDNVMSILRILYMIVCPYR